MATPNTSDIGQYFDLGEAAVSDSQQHALEQVSTTQPGERLVHNSLTVSQLDVAQSQTGDHSWVYYGLFNLTVFPL